MIFPAEWEPHEATWLAWPHNASDWPGKFAPIPWIYAEIVRRIAEGETVRLLTWPGARKVLEKSAVPLDRVQFLRIPTDRAWTRDSGPLFVLKDGKKAIAHFRFNAWAKYSDYKRDARIPERAAKILGVPLLPVGDVVLEGGAIDVNGQGALLTTEECLLDPEVQVRNQGFTRGDYEKVFASALGVTRTIWLGRGIAGDDTHGHIDDLARFVNARTIVLCDERDPADPNHVPLRENWERLRRSGFDLVALPMPAPVIFSGQRLPASYANFYVCNAAVLVPTFADPNDYQALGILKELFKDREVVGIPARDLVWGLGTLHCLSQQEPRQPRPPEAG